MLVNHNDEKPGWNGCNDILEKIFNAIEAITSQMDTVNPCNLSQEEFDRLFEDDD